MIDSYTFEVGKVLHHSTLEEDHTPGSLKPPPAKRIIGLYTFDVGKVLHHSTLPPLLHLPKALRPSKHQVRRTTSKPGVC